MGRRGHGVMATSAYLWLGIDPLVDVCVCLDDHWFVRDWSSLVRTELGVTSEGLIGEVVKGGPNAGSQLGVIPQVAAADEATIKLELSIRLRLQGGTVVDSDRQPHKTELTRARGPGGGGGRTCSSGSTSSEVLLDGRLPNSTNSSRLSLLSARIHFRLCQGVGFHVSGCRLVLLIRPLICHLVIYFDYFVFTRGARRVSTILSWFTVPFSFMRRPSCQRCPTLDSGVSSVSAVLRPQVLPYLSFWDPVLSTSADVAHANCMHLFLGSFHLSEQTFCTAGSVGLWLSNFRVVAVCSLLPLCLGLDWHGHDGICLAARVHVGPSSSLGCQPLSGCRLMRPHLRSGHPPVLDSPRLPFIIPVELGFVCPFDLAYVADLGFVSIGLRNPSSTCLVAVTDVS
ncbi:hypothetical protein R1flu_000152 [Riccia fluitans]|uniref:Uncharacterized protein n=1 Tax=Riccia fluitans TaxID=41844 RepID=A0ABD1XZM8_9MARC